MDNNINELIKLVQENPDVEVICMVDNEVVPDDSYGSWRGSIGKAKLDEYFCLDERIYFKSMDEDEIKKDHIDNISFDFEDEEATDEYLEELGDKYLASIEWHKAIVLNIDTP